MKVLAALVLGLVLAAPSTAQDRPPAGPGLVTDAAWAARQQLAFADLWNGGTDGTGGLGAYLPGFDGYIAPALDRRWQRETGPPTTVIAQARGIFGNVEAFLACRTLGLDGSRFLAAAEAAGSFLAEHFLDARYGGYVWSVARDGWVTDAQKQGYGQMHAWLALCRLAQVSSQPRWRELAVRQFDLVQSQMLDPAWPGAVLPGKDRAFRRVIGTKNIDTFTHYFETLQAFALIAPEPSKGRALAALRLAGDLLTSRLAVPIPSDPTLRMVAYNMTEDWLPSQEPYSRATQWSGAQHASPGHAAELAFLLSRAVEGGAPAAWLDTARALLDGVLRYADDPETGALRYETIGYDMSPLDGNPDNAVYIYWAQAENLRALAHFAARRDPSYRTAALKALNFVTTRLTDPVYGGWYQEVDAATLQATRTEKGDVWKGDYHEAMLLAELIRLGSAP